MNPGDETVTIELARSHAAAERSYQYGIPALIGVGIMATLVFAVLLWVLIQAVRELAAASRGMSASVALVGRARSTEDARAETRHEAQMTVLAAIMTAVTRR